MIDNLLADLPKIVSVFGLAFFYFWPAIPAGLALGLTPVMVVITTTLSYVCGVAVIALFGGKLRDWLRRRVGKQTTLNPGSFIGRIWQRFGLVGLGLAAPMTVGAQVGAALGIALNAKPGRLLVWMALGALAWSIVLTALVTLGVMGAQVLTQ